MFESVHWCCPISCQDLTNGLELPGFGTEPMFFAGGGKATSSLFRVEMWAVGGVRRTSLRSNAFLQAIRQSGF